MSWLWLLPAGVFAAGAIAVVVAARGTADAARDLASTARGLGHLEVGIVALRDEMSSFSGAANDLRRRQRDAGPELP